MTEHHESQYLSYLLRRLRRALHLPSSPPPLSPPAAVAGLMADAAPAAAAAESAAPGSPSPAASARAQRFVHNDPARTGFDPATGRWINYFRILMGQVTPEGVHHYREWRNTVNEAQDCRVCEEHRDYLFRYSPIIRFLSDKVADLNGRLDASNVVCRRCPARIRDDGAVVRNSGGFDPSLGILICANEVRSRKHLEDTLAHEMVHAWDHLRWKVDFTGDSTRSLRQAACTEVSWRTGGMLSTHGMAWLTDCR